MGVVIEICVKYPGGPTRNKGTDIYGYCMHACAAAKLQRQRTRGAMTPREGGTAAAGHIKL
jgi:hypothetical protein